MVFTTVINYVRSRGPDELWRKRRIFKLAAHFIGRRRNCYSIAIRYVHRALVFSTKARKLKKLDSRELWTTRLQASCEQHNINQDTFRESLIRSNILLNRKTLSNLAIWEPHTFKALTDIAKRRAVDEGIDSITKTEKLDGIIRRGCLK